METDFVTEAPEKVNFPYVDPQSHDEDFINFSIDYDGIEQVIKACKTLGRLLLDWPVHRSPP